MSFLKPIAKPIMEQVGSVSQDGSDRCIIDQEIRKLGFVIHSRPKTGQAVWKKGEILFIQSDLIRRFLDKGVGKS